jgi:integrase
MPSKYIAELQDVIRHLHSVESTHVESIPVKEQFQGRTVQEGVVEIFELHGHPKAPKIYAWAHHTDDPKKPKRHVTVLHIEPITSAVLAVRAAIVERFIQTKVETGLSGKTVRNFLLVLQGIMSLALDNDLIDRSPIRNRHKPTVDKHEKPIWSPAQLLNILRAAPTCLRAFFDCVALTGTRLGEVLALKMEARRFGAKNTPNRT